jgi:hypothetical protein
MNKRNIYAIVGLLLILSSPVLQGQNVSTKKIGDKHSAYIDSLKATPYPWHLPILGDKVRQLGFDIPYPNGIMVNYVVGSQYITLDNLEVGLDRDNLTNVDGIARFEHLRADVNVINFRYDVWLFPFLNVYALGGYVNSVTDVKLALPFSADFKAHSKGPMVGWGIAAAAGFGPIFVSGDFNMAWTFMPQLEGPSVAKVYDLRAGHSFSFKNRKSSSLSIMIGAQHLKLNPASAGSINLTDKLGITNERKEQALGELNDWYDGLPQNIQIDIGDFYNAMEGWLSNESDTYLYYTFNKRLYYPWSMTAGVNYQISHRHIVMALYTFLGSRNQLVVSYNYRFGFRGKNMLSGVEF